MNSDVKIIVGAVMIALVAVAAFIGWWCFYIWRVKAVLRTWAAEGGFKLLRFQRTNLTGRGPFKWWSKSRHQIIYHIRVRDREGRERSCWVRCGSYLGGVLFSNKTEVKWDEP